ncbi:hypothetical protein FQN52_002493 [Onygenales sp. PD_12]|nr:hypothetical protein FQN52_002493 [Onygenales sp. PD_12]
MAGKSLNDFVCEDSDELSKEPRSSLVRKQTDGRDYGVRTWSDLFELQMPSQNSSVRTADKRPLASDDANAHKMTPDQNRTKRRKIGRETPADQKAVPSTPSKLATPTGKTSGKKRRRSSAKEAGGMGQHGSKQVISKPTTIVQKTGDEASSALSKRSGESSSKDVELSSQSGTAAKWSISYNVGGRFSDVDPIFTADEQHFILVSNSTARIFSMATSCPVRALEVPQGMQGITACKLSPTNAEHLYMSTSSGSILKWNWVSGEQIQTWNVSPNVVDFAVCQSRGSGKASSDEDLVFSMNEGEGKTTILVNGGSSAPKPDQPKKVIREFLGAAKDIKVAAGGKIIVVIDHERLLLGYTTKCTSDTLQSLKYTWLEVTLPVSTTCSDLRERPSLPNSGIIDLVLGEKNGSILIYHDLLNSLLRVEKGADPGSSLVTNRLHWHRNTVKTVKWSKDGNYIISGGLESVIVQYQLDSGRKQFLPHLSSHICSLTVSPTGKSYAVRLADNSAMVISTAELRPIAYVSGLQLPTAAKKDKLPTSNVPAVLHPIVPDHLLLAVASAPARSPETPPSASFLQTFDLSSGQHVSRQALARTNASVIKTGPQGTDLTTPDVKHINISSSGDWLATIDEWSQYPEDVNVLHPKSLPSGKGKKEIFLKFWRWNESAKEWELSTRIDAPHSNAPFGPTKVLDLASNPAGLAFATIGEDAVVRIWSPSARYRNGQRLKDKRDQSLETWRAVHAIQLEKLVSGHYSPSKTASLAFSDDGSVLAVCWTGQGGSRLVYLINPETGEICHTRDNLYLGTPRGVGFLDRYVIILSDQLVIWDTVADKIKLIMLTEGKSASSVADSYSKILAINRKSQTFAVTFASSIRKGDKSSGERGRVVSVGFHVVVFDIRSLRPVFQSKLSHACSSLQPDLRTGEYVLIDSAAEIQRVSSGASQAIVRAAPESATALHTGLDNIFGAYGSLEKGLPGAGGLVPTTRQVGGEQVVAETGNLSDIFDVGPSFVLPGVDTLFEDVVKHFTGNTVAA